LGVPGGTAANRRIEKIPYYLAGFSFENVAEPGSLSLFGRGIAGLDIARPKTAA